MRFRISDTAAFLAILLLPSSVNAQADTWNQNITLRFFQDNQEGKCAYSNSSSALTFTTEDVPVISKCFDFADLFGGNASQGFVNQTWNLGGGSGYAGKPGQAGIHWDLENADSFDPQGNYSSVLYRQNYPNPSHNKKYEPGAYADRLVTLYPGKGCTELSPVKDELLSWYGFSCWSESEGSCGTVPYSIASFRVQPGRDEDQQPGKCWVFAELGAAEGRHVSFHAMVAVLVGTFVAIWGVL